MTTVLKFGGTSVENINKIKAIANRIKDRYEKGESLGELLYYNWL